MAQDRRTAVGGWEADVDGLDGGALVGTAIGESRRLSGLGLARDVKAVGQEDVRFDTSRRKTGRTCQAILGLLNAA